MAREKFAPGELYHLYNRGTEKRNIFSTKKDYERFVALLFLCNSKNKIHIKDLLPRGSTSGNLLHDLCEIERGDTLVDIGAYCLMPNHFHLLIKEKEEGGSSKFMQKLMTGYTMYFNTRHERTGALFQGKFKATHAKEDRYLKYLISYIHLNPVKLIEPAWKETGIADRKNAEAFLKSYTYSSYLDYTTMGTERSESLVLEKNCLPNYFETAKMFDAHITDWLDYFHE